MTVSPSLSFLKGSLLTGVVHGVAELDDVASAGVDTGLAEHVSNDHQHRAVPSAKNSQVEVDAALVALG